MYFMVLEKWCYISYISTVLTDEDFITCTIIEHVLSDKLL